MEGMRCRRHTTHKQSKGVCPSCLRERLTQLTDTSNPSSSLTPSACSSNSSLHSAAARSPPLRNSCRTTKISLLQLFNWKTTSEPLRRSRSLLDASAASAKDRQREKQQRQKKKKSVERRASGRLWSKLKEAGGGRWKEEGLSHSKTLKERPAPSSKWTFFS